MDAWRHLSAVRSCAFVSPPRHCRQHAGPDQEEIIEAIAILAGCSMEANDPGGGFEALTPQVADVSAGAIMLPLLALRSDRGFGLERAHPSGGRATLSARVHAGRR